jgi:glycosyltransferase involved in cell wall biosynthesis
LRIVITRRGPLDTPDGINNFIFSLAQQMIALGHEAIVAATTMRDHTNLEDLYGLSTYPHVVTLSRTSALSNSVVRSGLAWLIRGKAMVDRLKPDLVIVNGALPVSFRSTTCLVAHDVEPRMGRWGPVQTVYKHLTYRRPDHLIATSSEIRWALCGQLSIEPERIRVIPTCVNSDGYMRKPSTERRNAILHMGTLDYKNPYATLRAFALLESPSTRLYITGNISDRLKGSVDELPPSVRGRIELLGYVRATTLKELLGTVRIVSVPSKYFIPVASPTVLEAFASGTPVVASQGVTKDLVLDGVNGYVCPVDADELAAARFSDLLRDGELWSRMSNGAIQTAARFSSDSVARAYLSLV